MTKTSNKSLQWQNCGGKIAVANLFLKMSKSNVTSQSVNNKSKDGKKCEEKVSKTN